MSATIYFARKVRSKSADLRKAYDDLERRVRERTAELEQANEALLHVQDEERRRIARELHDSTVQILGAVAIDLEKIQRLVPDGDSVKARKLLADSSELVERATVELRTLSYLLHPPMLDDLGLEGALPWYAAGFSTRSGIRVRVDMRSDFGRIERELELTLFRIVQEALTNIQRHSGSPTAEITMFRDVHRVTLEVTDRGKGIPPGVLEPVGNARASVGVGIAGMRERVRQLGGQMEIASSEGGTLLRAVLPVGSGNRVSEYDSERDS
jgi:signal transduction histidine kinase